MNKVNKRVLQAAFLTAIMLASSGVMAESGRRTGSEAITIAPIDPEPESELGLYLWIGLLVAAGAAGLAKLTPVRT